MGAKLHLSPDQVETALQALDSDGIVRKESYKTSDLTKKHPTQDDRQADAAR